MEPESFSWVLRSHFSRTVCHRPGSFTSPLPPLLPQLPASLARHTPVPSEFTFPSPPSSGWLSDDSSSSSKPTCDANDFDLGTAFPSPSSSCFSSINAPSPSTDPKDSPACRKSASSEADGCDMHRVHSWSHYFASHGNEKAVISAEKWMVDLSQLLLGERFACGNHSRLYRGIYRESPVAVKVIQLVEDGALADRLEQIFTQEVTILSFLQHRNVIKFIAACKKPPVLCVITEYLPGGSLRSFLHKREGCRLPTTQIVRMALDLASGMEYLHSKRVIHRDLKSENLVLSEGECLKIVDFGVSCFEAECDYRADDPGTYRWMAPEMLRHNHYTRKVDVYSFGIVLWELVTTHLPYEEMSAVQAAFAVLHKNARPAIPPDCPPLLKDLMRQCWCTNSEQRPEFWEILRTLTTLERSLDDCNIHPEICPDRHRFLPGCLQCE